MYLHRCDGRMEEKLQESTTAKEKYYGRTLQLQKVENNLVSCIPLYLPALYKNLLYN